MKKLLTLIGAITLTTTGSMALISCGGDNGTKEDENQAEIPYEELMTSKASKIFSGELTMIYIKEDKEIQAPLDKISILELLVNFTIENNDGSGKTKWLEGFLDTPNGTLNLNEELKYVFRDFNFKNEYKSQKQIILDSTITFEYSETGAGDKVTISNGVDSYTE